MPAKGRLGCLAFPYCWILAPRFSYFDPRARKLILNVELLGQRLLQVQGLDFCLLDWPNVVKKQQLEISLLKTENQELIATRPILGLEYLENDRS
jgi:hypothetical protein